MRSYFLIESETHEQYKATEDSKKLSHEDMRKKIGEVELWEEDFFMSQRLTWGNVKGEWLLKPHDLTPDGTSIVVGKNFMPIPVKGYFRGIQKGSSQRRTPVLWLRQDSTVSDMGLNLISVGMRLNPIWVTSPCKGLNDVTFRASNQSHMWLTGPIYEDAVLFVTSLNRLKSS